MVLGVGDALVFISVMRLVPAWFPPERSAKLTNATGPVNQLGFVLSAVGFAAVLAAAGWTPSFLSAAAVSAASRGAGAAAAPRLAARASAAHTPRGRARHGRPRGPRGVGGTGHPAGVLDGVHGPVHGHDVRRDVGLPVPDGGPGALPRHGGGADAGARPGRPGVRRHTGHVHGPPPVLPQPHRDRRRRGGGGDLGGRAAVAGPRAALAARRPGAGRAGPRHRRGDRRSTSLARRIRRGGWAARSAWSTAARSWAR